MDMHPAYPTPAAVRRQLDIARTAEAARQTNAHVWAVLSAALEHLHGLDLDTHSMIPGYDLRDVVSGLRDMRPLLDDAAQLEKLDEWARDRVGECVA